MDARHRRSLLRGCVFRPLGKNGGAEGKFAPLLSEAVPLLAYEWRQAGTRAPSRRLEAGRAVQATKAELLGFFARLESELDACGFLRHRDMRPIMVRSLRNIFHRAGLMAHEVRTLHGVVTGLTQRPHAARPQAARVKPPPAPASGARPQSPRRGRAT